MEQDIKFTNGITIQFDDALRRDAKTVNMLITQYFKKGKAVHIKLDEKQVNLLYEKLHEFKS